MYVLNISMYLTYQINQSLGFYTTMFKSQNNNYLGCTEFSLIPSSDLGKDPSLLKLVTDQKKEGGVL